MRIEWKKYKVQLHEVGRSRWRRGIKTEENWLPHFVSPRHDLLFITGGKARIRLRRGWTELRPGLCVWLRPDQEYQAEQDPNEPLCNTFFHFDLVDTRGHKRSARAPWPAELIEPPDAEMAAAVTRRIVEMSFGFDAHGFVRRFPTGPVADVAQALFTGLLMELDGTGEHESAGAASRLKREQHLVQAAAARILEAPHDKYKPRKLAQQSGYSADHFARLFRKHTGMNPEQFTIRARVHRAQRLLRETELTVKAVSESLGYSEIYFFSRQFKQVTGRSPTEYRQQTSANRHRRRRATP